MYCHYRSDIKILNLNSYIINVKLEGRIRARTNILFSKIYYHPLQMHWSVYNIFSRKGPFQGNIFKKGLSGKYVPERGPLWKIFPRKGPFLENIFPKGAPFGNIFQKGTLFGKYFPNRGHVWRIFTKRGPF